MTNRDSKIWVNPFSEKLLPAFENERKLQYITRKRTHKLSSKCHMEASKTRFNSSNVQLDELLRGKIDVNGGIFKLCAIKKTTCNSSGIQRILCSGCVKHNCGIRTGGIAWIWSWRWLLKTVRVFTLDNLGADTLAYHGRHSPLCFMWRRGIAVKALEIAMTAKLTNIWSLNVVAQQCGNKCFPVAVVSVLFAIGIRYLLYQAFMKPLIFLIPIFWLFRNFPFDGL